MFTLDMPNFINNIAVKTKYGAMAVTVTPFVIFASIYVAWAYMSRNRRGPNKLHGGPNKLHGVLQRSVSLGVLHGGKLSLERLMDYHHARADKISLKAAEIELEDLLQKEHPDFKELQRTVGRLEMSGQDAKAVGILTNALTKAQKHRKQHEAYEIEMLLVEMLIYMGDFETALHCKCLQEQNISDARRPLYKAIIHLLLGHPREESIFYWEQFNDIRGDFQWPPWEEDSQLYEVIENFDKFERIVMVLKHDIQEANKKQSVE